MGNGPKIPANANNPANGLKIYVQLSPHFFSRPSRITYMGPPCTLPSESSPRYKMARVQVKNLVAIPTKALTHIQKRAPGPPIKIATATPLILPIPTVAARALDSASKCVISPGSSGSSYRPRRILSACLKYLKGAKRE